MVRRRLAGMAVAAVVGLGLVVACGSDDDNDKDKTSTDKPSETTTYTWAKDINPIVKASCSASTCHGKTSPGSLVYEDSEATFKGASTMLERLGTGPTGNMPTGGGQPTALSEANRQKLIDFYKQK